MVRYNPAEIEAKWAKKWEKEKAWEVDLEKAQKPYYNLMMFPYPSAEGLHVGNVYAFTGADIHGRFRRMQGFDVFEPMGFDSFGIHSENFALKKGTHPKEQTAKNITNFTQQLKTLGALFDWSRAVTTSEPEYYKWTQWLFLQLYKAGLAYKAKAPVDWCPSCKTVLADEQVIHGKCERCDTQIVQKELEQWFFAITKYAERLLKNLETIDWSERTKIAQRNWIGRSEGALLKFEIRSTKSEQYIEVFTTRPDTLFGATYMVLAPEHELVGKLKDSIENWGEVEKYINGAKQKNELERTELEKEKTGVELKGIKAVNPANKQEIPVYAADYVFASYGTGAVMAVPAHDERDFEFAKKYNLPIMQVICGDYPEQTCPALKEAYTGPGNLVGSGKFDGMDSEEAKAKIVEFAKGKLTTTYHLRDWLISRQRYWGPPIPIIYCRRCWEIRNSKFEIRNFKEGIDYIFINGKEHIIVPVPEKDLPVELLYVENFRPEGSGKSPLANVPEFVNTTCPQCGGAAQRETDVSDTFLDSSWYYLRYPSVGFRNSKFEIRNSKQIQNTKSKTVELPWNTEITGKWLPVDMYIGGQEHAVLHLLYARFITMALYDMGFIAFEEPFQKFRAHGLITKDGAKMSKSKGNVVSPDEFVAKYGADAVRCYLMFTGPFSEGGDWSDKGIVGVSRFFNRVWDFLQHEGKNLQSGEGLEQLRHKTIKKVTEDLEQLHYNTVVAGLMEYFNAFSGNSTVSLQDAETLLLLLAPLAPHLTEELWEQLGKEGSCHNKQWPSYDVDKIQEETFRLVFQVNGKPRDVVEVETGISEEGAKKAALGSEKVQKWLAGKEPKRIVVVPGKLVNIVV